MLAEAQEHGNVGDRAERKTARKNLNIAKVKDLDITALRFYGSGFRLALQTSLKRVPLPSHGLPFVFDLWADFLNLNSVGTKL